MVFRWKKEAVAVGAVEFSCEFSSVLFFLLLLVDQYHITHNAFFAFSLQFKIIIFFESRVKKLEFFFFTKTVDYY